MPFKLKLCEFLEQSQTVFLDASRLPIKGDIIYLKLNCKLLEHMALAFSKA